MAQVERIRYLLHVEGKSQRQVAKMLGISRHTVAKYANKADVPRYQRRKPVPTPVLTPEFQLEIERRLAENETLPKKQRWTAQTVYEELVALGYTGSESTVRRHIARVRKAKRKHVPFIPLAHEPGDSMEIDWGEAEATLAGDRQKVQLLCVRLRWSGMPVVIAYPNQRQEAMLDGLRRALEFFGGVPRRITSDNLKQAVKRMLEGRNRQEQEAYLSFRTHYLIDSNFCNPASGHEKGSVESLVGLAQRYIVGPHCEATDFEHLNAILLQRSLKYAERTLPGQVHSIRERWEQEKRVLRPLPERPFDCCKTVFATCTKTACVTFETNRYSVPTQYATQTVQIRAYWDRIDIFAGNKQIASHSRSYGRYQEIFDLNHYLEALLQKPGALDQAKPFRAAHLPAAFHRFLAELRAHKRHDREFIQILMLLRIYPMVEVTAALVQALTLRTISYDAVKQLLESQAEFSGSTAASILAGIRVQQPPLDLYDRLLNGGGLH